MILYQSSKLRNDPVYFPQCCLALSNEIFCRLTKPRCVNVQTKYTGGNCLLQVSNQVFAKGSTKTQTGKKQHWKKNAERIGKHFFFYQVTYINNVTMASEAI